MLITVCSWTQKSGGSFQSVSVCRFAFVRFRTKEEVLQALWSLQDSDIQVFIPDEKGSSPPKTPFAALRNSPVKTTRTFVAKASPEQRNPGSSSQAHLSQVDNNLGTILLLPPSRTVTIIIASFHIRSKICWPF